MQNICQHLTLSISSKTEFSIDEVDRFLDSRMQKIVPAALFCKVLGSTR